MHNWVPIIDPDITQNTKQNRNEIEKVADAWGVKPQFLTTISFLKGKIGRGKGT